MAPPRNRRPGFSRRAQYGLFLSYVIAVAGAIVAAVLLAISTFAPQSFAALRSGAAEATTPISSGLAGITGFFAAIPEAIGGYFGVMGENKALRREIADEHALVMHARAIKLENARLRALLKVRDRGPGAVVVARLVNSTASSTRRYATLNAGFFQGVQVGQPVRGPEGLIGRILEAGPDSARVLLLTDAENVVPVRRTRDGLPALAAGRGDGWLDVRSVDVANADFRPGDVFVTTGTGGIYAPNVPVARTVQPGRDTALAQPIAHPDTLDYALVSQAFFPAATVPLPTPTPAPKPKPKPTAKPAKAKKR